MSDTTAVYQPDELGALKVVLKDFIHQIETIDNEIETLKADRKEAIEAAKEKLDVKTLNQVLRVLKIKAGVQHKDTFDTFLELLETGEVDNTPLEMIALYNPLYDKE